MIKSSFIFGMATILMVLSLKPATSGTQCPVIGVDPNICSRVVHFFDELAKKNPEFAKEWQNHQYVYQGSGSVAPDISLQTVEYMPGRFTAQVVSDQRMPLQQFISQELSDPAYASLTQSHNYFAMTVLALEHGALKDAGSSWHQTFYLSGENMNAAGGGFIAQEQVADSRGISPSFTLAPPTPADGTKPLAGTQTVSQSPSVNAKNAYVPSTSSARRAPPGSNRNNINQYFVTPEAGSQTQRNVRSYLLDSEDKLWSCMVSGMGLRAVSDHNGQMLSHGHIETLHVKSTQLAHVPGNHPNTNRCLIAVHK